MRNTIHSLVKQGMETWSMIHLLQMSEFVVYDEVLQMRRQEHEVEAQMDISHGTAATPARGGAVDGDLTGSETTL